MFIHRLLREFHFKSSSLAPRAIIALISDMIDASCFEPKPKEIYLEFDIAPHGLHMSTVMSVEALNSLAECNTKELARQRRHVERRRETEVVQRHAQLQGETFGSTIGRRLVRIGTGQNRVHVRSHAQEKNEGRDDYL